MNAVPVCRLVIGERAFLCFRAKADSLDGDCNDEDMNNVLSGEVKSKRIKIDKSSDTAKKGKVPQHSLEGTEKVL
jgi:hypothetical protein